MTKDEDRKTGLLRIDPMPDRCDTCPLILYDDDSYCMASPAKSVGKRSITDDELMGERRPDWCPLVEAAVRDAWSTALNVMLESKERSMA